VVQLLIALTTVEVVRMDDLELVHQMLSVDWKTALLAKLLRTSFDFGIAGLTKWPSLALDKANICQLPVATDTLEAVGVPALTHCADHSPDHKFTTATAAWGKQSVEVMGAVLPPLVLVKLFVLERLEALDTNEASLVPDLTSRVDDVLVSTEGILTQRTHHSWIHDER
jgi:hypothetical protein